MTVIRSIASAQSRVATLHLIVHELLVFLVVPEAIEVPASVRGGGARTRNRVGGHVKVGRRLQFPLDSRLDPADTQQVTCRLVTTAKPRAANFAS